MADLTLSRPLPSIEPALDALVLRCLATEPEDRYQNVAELAGGLEDLAARLPWTEDEARTWWKESRD